MRKDPVDNRTADSVVPTDEHTIITVMIWKTKKKMWHGKKYLEIFIIGENHLFMHVKIKTRYART